MDSDRAALRAKLRSKIQSKRSVRSGELTSTPSHANMEGVALSLAGSDAQTLNTVLDVLKHPARARDVLKTRPDVAEDVAEDDEEAPPPVPT